MTMATAIAVNINVTVAVVQGWDVINTPILWQHVQGHHFGISESYHQNMSIGKQILVRRDGQLLLNVN
jgi:hypothetical protein